LKAGPAFAAGQLMTSAIIAFLAGAMFWASGRNRCWAAALAALALIDLVCYARSTVTTFDPQISRPAMMANWFATHPGDYRILQQTFGFNSVMAFNQYDVWGYDPAVVRRYAQLLLAIEKQDANAPLTNAPFTYPGPGLRLVRCKYMFGDLGGRVVVAEMSDPLPHALLVHRVRRITERDIIFGALLSPSFDGRHEVVLENAPNIQPMPARNPGVVSAVWKDSDTLEVSASTASPAILLITDTYSRFWNVHPLAGCSQPEYSVMPGDYALIAIPLREGRHHFLLNYCPPIYRAGLYISLAALALFTFLCCLSYRAHKGRRTIV